MNRKLERELVQEAYERGRALGRLPLVLIPGNPTAAPEPIAEGARGVEEAVYAPAGYRKFTVVASDGEVLEECLIATRLATPRYIQQRHKLLEAADPQARLRII